MIVGGVTAFPGTPLGTIRESSSSWGSPGATENPASLSTCKEDDQVVLIGSCAPAPDVLLQQGGQLQGQPSSEGAFQLSSERQTCHEVEGKEAEAAGNLQSPFDSASDVAESPLLGSVLNRHGSSSAASVISEVMSEADGAVQAVSPTGDLIIECHILCA